MAFVVPTDANEHLEQCMQQSWNHFNHMYLNPTKDSFPETHGIYPCPLYMIFKTGKHCQAIDREAQTELSNITKQNRVKCDRMELDLFQPDGCWKSGTREMSYAVSPKLYKAYLGKNFKGPTLNFPSKDTFVSDFRSNLR